MGSRHFLAATPLPVYVHFLAMSAIVGFLTIHIVLALIVPKSLRR